MLFLIFKFSLMVLNVAVMVLKNVSLSTHQTHYPLSQDLRVETLEGLLKCRPCLRFRSPLD